MSRAPERVLPALLVLVALVAGWRTLASTRAVLGGARIGTLSADRQAAVREESKEQALIARLVRDDSTLAAIEKARIPGDPFRPRLVEGPSRPKPPPPEPVIVTPAVVLCAFDRERPEVVLRIGELTSGRLTLNQTWEGWTVALIDRSAVELTGYDRTVRIPVPNQM